MSSPFCTRAPDEMQLVSAAPAVGGDGESGHTIPRRLMRVKVLYTFDDEHKSNCLARLPYAANVPTVSLDETTEIGVIDLKTCIQAIVSASPELVARLGHDFTVYAYDFSEYETPLVGQGMLSWILAAASTTPHVPADQSKTMVTGRVCKNILGLFSNGIKETLEVKLKLVPVPTCLQKDYVENMERYHNLSQLMPEGLDYQAWAEFLQTNPTIAQLAHPSSEQYLHPVPRNFGRGNEQIQHMLTNQVHQAHHTLHAHHTHHTHPAPSAVHSYPDQAQAAPYGTRPSSPAMSAISFSHYQHQPSQDSRPTYQDSRPASQASFRSDAVPQHQMQFPSYAPNPVLVQDQPEEGPPKKRARVTKAARPKKAPLVAKNESLRVTASTAASVRLHRPAATTPIIDLTAMDQVPRAPTPRPGDKALPQSRAHPRLPAQSNLRHTSMDEGRPFSSQYESALFSDAVVDSADDEIGNSAGETPMDIPSSPPIMEHRTASSVPSSPGLPSFPYPADSGFVSDMPQGREDEETGPRVKVWEGSDLPTAPDPRTRRKQDRSNRPWTEVTPGPVELLPKSFVAKPKTYPRNRSQVEKMEKVVEDAPQISNTKAPAPSNVIVGHVLRSLETPSECPVYGDAAPSTVSASYQAQNNQIVDLSKPSLPDEQLSRIPMIEARQDCQSQQVGTDAGSPDSTINNVPEDNINPSQESTRGNTPNLPPKRSRPSKPRALPRSQTWSGAGEPMSDAISESGLRQPRSGSGAKRKQYITEQLEQSLAKGEMPAYCHHCGEIETPTWRKAYTRVEQGSPSDILLSSEGNGIAGYEIVEPTEDDDGPKYRIFKQALDKAERDSGIYVQLNLCNPCGLWLNKKNTMRPRELWAKKVNDKPKRKRNPPKGPRKKSKGPMDENQSDAIVPHPEPVMIPDDGDFGVSNERYAHQSMRYRSSSIQIPSNASTSQLDEATAMAALYRAIQSSPVRISANKTSLSSKEAQLTPSKPTRRLLFPSPRKMGEVKSLNEGRSVVSPKTQDGLFEPADPILRLLEAEDVNKENCQPPTHNDDLSHLFDEHISTKTTPTKDGPFQDFLKTPTPGSRKRNALNARSGTENNGDVGLRTPSRNIMTPNRGGRAAITTPETPFTKQLNALLSDCLSSPSQPIDFSGFPPFNLTPGREAQFTDFLDSDFLSSDLPRTSSPHTELGFALYEDPTASSVGLWSGVSMFEGSDNINLEESGQRRSELKAADITVDFSAMIEGVVGKGASEDHENDARTVSQDEMEMDAAAQAFEQTA